MKHATRILCALYAVAAGVMLRCANISHHHGENGWAAAYGAIAIVLALAIGHHAYHRDELRSARARLEHVTRIPGPLCPAVDEVIAVAMAGWCCDAWAATAGADHDPATCTRKGHAT